METKTKLNFLAIIAGAIAIAIGTAIFPPLGVALWIVLVGGGSGMIYHS